MKIVALTPPQAVGSHYYSIVVDGAGTVDAAYYAPADFPHEHRGTSTCIGHGQELHA
jgi:hypothetical protein